VQLNTLIILIVKPVTVTLMVPKAQIAMKMENVLVKKILVETNVMKLILDTSTSQTLKNVSVTKRGQWESNVMKSVENVSVKPT